MRRRLGGLTSVSALLWAIAVHQSVSTQGTHVDTSSSPFLFVAGRCESVGEQYCEGPEWKQWNGFEISLVGNAVAEITRHPLGAAVITQSHVRHVRRVVRSHEEPLADAFSPRDIPSPFIALTDRFFGQSGLRDVYSGSPGYLLMARIVLHELFHAVDRIKGYSQTDEFLNVVGFARGGTNVVTIPLIPSLPPVFTRINQLNESRQYAKAWEISRRVARSLGRPNYPTAYPSLQAFLNEREAFAEIGAHVILDPLATAYLSGSLIEFFRQRVFDGAK